MWTSAQNPQYIAYSYCELTKALFTWQQDNSCITKSHFWLWNQNSTIGSSATDRLHYHGSTPSKAKNISLYHQNQTSLGVNKFSYTKGQFPSARQMEDQHAHLPQSSAKIRNTYALPEYFLMSSWHDVQTHRAILETIMPLCCKTTLTAEKNSIFTHRTHCMDALPTSDYHCPMETLWRTIKCL